MSVRPWLLASLLMWPGLVWAANDDTSDANVGAGLGETISVTPTDQKYQADDLEEICGGTVSDVTIRLTTNETCLDCQVYVWWMSSSSTDCTGAAPTDTISNTKLSFTGGTTIVFPDDFDNVDAFTERDVFDHADACPADGAAASAIDTDVTLCVAADVYGTGDSQIDTNDPYGWVRFKIDTELPPAPEIDEALVEVGDKEIQVPVTTSGDAADDIVTWHEWHRPAPMIEDELGEMVVDPDVVGCADWSDDGSVAKNPQTADDPNDDIVTIDGIKNGVTYEICVRAEDDAGNLGPWSATVRATPRDECDFFECYPRELETGYCGAVSPPSLLFLLLVGLVRRLRGGRA